MYPDGSRTDREEVRGIYGFTTDMFENEDAGSGTWMWPRPAAAVEGYQAVELTRFEHRRAEQYEEDYKAWLDGAADSSQRRKWYYQLVSKVEIHRRGPAPPDPYVYDGPRSRTA